MFSPLNSRSAMIGSTRATTSGGMSSAEYSSSCALNASTLAIMRFAFSHEKSRRSFRIIICTAVVTLSTPAGGFVNAFSSDKLPLSRQFTASLARIIIGLASASSFSASSWIFIASPAARSAFSFSPSASACCFSASPRCFPMSSSSSSVACLRSSTLTMVTLSSSCSSATVFSVFRSVLRPVSSRWINASTSFAFSRSSFL
mmetsp:Transcript_9920/g.31250  ORF Transcript_9920/g.31250 Transcript_9920/m.31250 type:complete len:202 (-) Transcript_9920:676-1281(-)